MTRLTAGWQFWVNLQPTSLAAGALADRHAALDGSEVIRPQL